MYEVREKKKMLYTVGNTWFKKIDFKVNKNEKLYSYVLEVSVRKA